MDERRCGYIVQIRYNGGIKVKFGKLKKAICIALAGVMVLGTQMTAFASEQEGTVTYTKAPEMAKFTFKGYNNGTLPTPTTSLGLLEYTLETFVMGDEYNGPIGIVEATLHQNGVSKPVYIVALSGTELIWSDYTGIQSTGAATDLLCGFNLNNPYIKAVKKAMVDNIPEGSDVIFYGHSLGGMIAQQAAAERVIKKNFNVLNTITYGSPLIKLLSGREGVVRRLCDKSDIVPVLSVYSLTPLAVVQYWGSERYSEDGGYNSKWLAAHNESYLREDVWGNYDVLGIKGGNASLTFDMENTYYFEAPGIDWLKLK